MTESFLLSVAVGFVAGVASGMLGIGGGMVTVPAMVLALGVEQHVAQGVSLAVIAVTATMGTVAHVRYGNVVWGAAVIIAPVAAVFGVVGATIAGDLDPLLLRRIFACVLLFFGARMLLAK